MNKEIAVKRFIIILPLILSACATAAPDSVAKPTAIISTGSTQKVINKVTELCDRREWQIDQATANSVTCSNSASQVMQMLFSTKYGTEVRNRMQFNAFPVDGRKVKVTPRIWLESETALGQTKKQTLDTADIRKSAQEFLNEVKSEVEKH